MTSGRRPRGTVHGDLSQMGGRPRMNGASLLRGAARRGRHRHRDLLPGARAGHAQRAGRGRLARRRRLHRHRAEPRPHHRRADARPGRQGRAARSAARSAWLLLRDLDVRRRHRVHRATHRGPAVRDSGGHDHCGGRRAGHRASVGADNPLLAALLFLALYLATGTVAAIAGYLRHNTAAKQYAVTLRTRASAGEGRRLQRGRPRRWPKQTMVALDEERRRRAEGWLKAQEEWQAIARRLKQEARLRLAAAAQDPSTTDAYFVPPRSGGPASGVPASGIPASGVPATGVPASGYAAASPLTVEPAGGRAAAPRRAAVPSRRPGPEPGHHTRTRAVTRAALPAVEPPPQWRPRRAARQHRPIGGPGGTARAEQSRRDGGQMTRRGSVWPSRPWWSSCRCWPRAATARSRPSRSTSPARRQPGGPVTLAVGARANSPTPVLPPAGRRI